MKKVIIISAHPDDETLGAGGTILKHKSQGDEVFWLITTKMTESSGYTKETIKNREEEIIRVSQLYGFTKTLQLEFPTQSYTSETLSKLIAEISKILSEIQPEIIYTPNRSDAHSDHRILFDAVFSCTKSFRYPFIKRVLMYECISETEFAPALHEKVFLPNYFVDISNFLDQKLEIMKVFDSELGQHPFPRSLKNIEALATFRGATAGVFYAESFQIIKIIE